VSLSTEGFTYLGTLKVPAVSGATSTDTPLVVRSAAYTTAMIADLKSDGGDLRFSGDIGGNTQYPIEIVDGLDIVWTLVPSVAVDTLIYVWGNKPAAVKEIDTATYGSEAVWVNSKLRAHLGATVYDSAGNNTLNFDNSTEVTGQIGSARDYNGTNQYGRFNNSSSNSNIGSKGKSSVWFRPDSGVSSRALICFDKSNTSNYKHLLYISGSSQSVAAYVRLTDGAVYAVGYDTGAVITAWSRVTATYDRSLSTDRLKLYFNGALVGTNDCDNLDVGNNTDGVSLARWGGSSSYSGKIDEYDLSTDVSADKELIEYQNQAVTSGAWWIATDAGGGTAGVTGTATASITEADIVTGGKTIILTLSGDTFVAAGTGPIGSTADTQAIIDGITSAQTETLGWNNEVRDTEVTTAVVRTSSTVATITLTASASYDITATETITATLPAVALTLAAAVVATPTFTVAPVASGFQPAWARGSNVVLQ
jgi:hypothetical protein